MKQWYDGYLIGEQSVYNTGSVKEALQYQRNRSCWTRTSASKSLMEYISIDFDGMAQIPNEEIRVEFARSVRQVKHDETIRRVRESDQLIDDTVHRNAGAVAARFRERKYPEAVSEYGGEVLLVGISCRKDAPAGQRRHTCVIERHQVSCERDAKGEVYGRGTIVEDV